MTTFKIGWLDSANQASSVHLTDTNGLRTRCGYPTARNFKEGVWTQAPTVPSKAYGRSRWCPKCLEGTKKDGQQWLGDLLSLDEWQRKLDSRKERLGRLRELNAPLPIIERELVLVAEAEETVKGLTELG